MKAGIAVTALLLLVGCTGKAPEPDMEPAWLTCDRQFGNVTVDCSQGTFLRIADMQAVPDGWTCVERDSKKSYSIELWRKDGQPSPEGRTYGIFIRLDWGLRQLHDLQLETGTVQHASYWANGTSFHVLDAPMQADQGVNIRLSTSWVRLVDGGEHSMDNVEYLRVPTDIGPATIARFDVGEMHHFLPQYKSVDRNGQASFRFVNFEKLDREGDLMLRHHAGGPVFGSFSTVTPSAADEATLLVDPIDCEGKTAVSIAGGMNQH